MENINIKRVGISLLLGIIAGILCAGGSIILNPSISMDFLFHIVYLRIILGLIIGLIAEIEFIDHEIGNSIIRGASMGILLSIPLLMVTVSNGPVDMVLIFIFDTPCH